MVGFPAAAQLHGQILHVEREQAKLEELLEASLQLPAKAHERPIGGRVEFKPAFLLEQVDHIVEVEPWRKELLVIAHDAQHALGLVGVGLVALELSDRLVEPISDSLQRFL